MGDDTEGGDADEVDADFTVYFRDLFPLAYSDGVPALGGATAAEDIAAEAFERAYARWSSIKRLPYRDTWVLRVTANLALSVLRRRHPVLPEPGSTVEDDAIATRLALVAALRMLPRRRREVIVLHYLAGVQNARSLPPSGSAPTP